MPSRTLVERTVDRFGSVDIVVNNAATGLTLPIGELTTDAWEKSIAVNLRGPVFLVERALPYLIQSTHGVILNVISAGAFLFSARTAMYAAAKAGMMAMTRSQSAALAEHGIRANALRARDGRHRHGAEQHTGADRVHEERGPS